MPLEDDGVGESARAMRTIPRRRPATRQMKRVKPLEGKLATADETTKRPPSMDDSLVIPLGANRGEKPPAIATGKLGRGMLNENMTSEDVLGAEALAAPTAIVRLVVVTFPMVEKD